MISVLNNPLAKHNLSIIRNKITSGRNFRDALRRLSYLLAAEASANLKLEDYSINTPVAKTRGYSIIESLALLAILPSGLALQYGFIDFFPDIKIGIAGLRKDDITLMPEEYYFSMPKLDENSKVFVLEIAIASGSSVCWAIDRLMLEGVEKITICSIIAAPEGIEKIITDFPNVEIYTAALDAGLDINGLVTPGFGDAFIRMNE